MILLKKKKQKVKPLVLVIFDSFRIVWDFLFEFKQLSLTSLMDAQALHKSFHIETEFFVSLSFCFESEQD